MMKKMICCLTAALLLLTAACGAKAPAAPALKEGVTLQSLVDSIAEKYPVTMAAALDDTIVQDLLGISLDDVEEYAGYLTMVNVSADNLIAIKAKDGKAEDIQKKLEERREMELQSFQQYLQDQYDKAQEGRVLVIGNYVFLTILGSPDGDAATDAADIEKMIRDSFTE